MKNTVLLLFLLLLSHTAFCQIPESVIKKSTVKTPKREVLKATKSIRLAPGTKIASGMRFSARIVPQEQVEATIPQTNSEASISKVTAFEIEIFPNPAISEAQVELSNSEMRIDEAALYSITGAMVKKYSITQENRNSSRHRFNVSDIPGGLYILTLSKKGTAILSKKLLIGAE